MNLMSMSCQSDLESYGSPSLLQFGFSSTDSSFCHLATGNFDEFSMAVNWIVLLLPSLCLCFQAVKQLGNQAFLIANSRLFT